MGHRQLAALLGLRVVRAVGIPGEEDRFTPVHSLHHAPHHVGHDVKRLFCPEGAGDEIILHVHYDQNIHGDMLLSVFPNIANILQVCKKPRGKLEKEVDFFGVNSYHRPTYGCGIMAETV